MTALKLARLSIIGFALGSIAVHASAETIRATYHEAPAKWRHQEGGMRIEPSAWTTYEGLTTTYADWCTRLEAMLGYQWDSTRGGPGACFRNDIFHSYDSYNIQVGCPDGGGLGSADTGYICRIYTCPSGQGWQLDGQDCYRNLDPVATAELLGAPQCHGDGTASPSTPHPINIISGNKYLGEVDVSANLLEGLPLSRHYNALGGYATLAMGGNWKLNIDRALSFDTADLITAYRGDGRQTSLLRDGNLFKPRGGGKEWASRIMDGETVVGWRYNDAAGNVEQYDAMGRLTSITNAKGQAWMIARDNGRITSVTNLFGKQVGFGYDASERLSSLTLPNGSLIGYGYDGNGNLSTITYPDGSARRYTYNEPSQTGGVSLPRALTAIIDENGTRYISYTYDSAGRAFAEELAGGVGRYELTFNSYNTVVKDPLGTSRTYPYSPNLYVAKSTGVSQPGGSGCNAASSALGRDSNGNVVYRTDFNGNSTYYTSYDLTRNLETQRIEAAGKPEARTVSTQWHTYWRQPSKVAEPKKLTTWTYNGDAGVYCAPQSATVPSLSGGTQPIGVLCSKTEQATTDETGAAGLAATATGAPRTWTYTYNQYGQILTADGPRTDVSDVTTYTYYAADDPDLGKRGQIATVTNPLGHLTRHTAYDKNGRLLSMTDPNGTVTSFTHTPRGWLKTRTVTGQTTTCDHTPWGGLERVSYPDGTWIHYDHDPAHRLTGLSDSAGHSVSYTLDAAGNRTHEEYKNADGSPARQISRVFDALGRLKDEIEGASPPRTFGYTANGEPRYTITPKGDTSSDEIDPLGRPVKRTDPENGSAKPTLIAYDRLDQLTRLTAPNGAITAFDIDGLGNTWKETSADRGNVDASFDAAGNLLTRKDARGVTVSYGYDALNRLTQITTSNGKTQTLSWDNCTNGIGRLCQTTDTAGTTTYAYDARGNLTGETRHEGGRSFTTTTAHNAADRPTDLIAPTGEALVPTLDPGGKTQALSAIAGGTTTIIASAITYNATGKITAQQLGLTWLTMNYDSAGRVDSETATVQAEASSNGDVPLPSWALAVLGATLFGLTRRRPAGATLSLFVACILTLFLAVPPAEAADLDLDYDANGNVISKTTTGGTTAYTYDKLDRLDTETGPPGNRDHAYDPNGNRTADGAGTTATYTANSDRVATLNGVSVTLDAAGNLTADGTYKYVWDDFGDLVELRKADNTLLATYYYDYRHRRTRKVTTAAAPQGADTVFYLHDQWDNLLAEMGSSGEALMTYVWNGDTLTGVIVHQPQRTVYTVQVDHLGTPYQVRTLDGKIVWRWEPDGYGRTQPNEDVDGDGKKLTLNVRFPGQYFDKESGLHYNWHRYYSPKIGYISPDPIGLEAGPNPYAYANQNPLIYTDPEGLSAAGAMKGARIGGAAGSRLGPAGGIVGAAVGAGVGYLICNQTEQDRDEQACDREYEADIRYCASLASVRGLSRGRRAYNDVYSRCIAAAEEKYVQCYQDAGKK